MQSADEAIRILAQSGAHHEVVQRLLVLKADHNLTFSQSLLLARSLFLDNERAEAKQYIESIECRKDLQPNDLAKVVELWAEMKVHHRVCKLGRRVLSLNPQEFTVRELVVLSLIEQKEVDAARVILTDGLKLETLELRHLLRISSLLGLVQDLANRLSAPTSLAKKVGGADADLALQVAQKAVRLAPDSFAGQLTLAEAYIGVGDFSRTTATIVTLRAACLPKSSGEWLKVGLLLLKLGDANGVRQAVKSAIECPDWSTKFVTRAVTICTEIGDRDQALSLVDNLDFEKLGSRADLKAVHECFFRFGENEKALNVARIYLNRYDDDPAMRERVSTIAMLARRASQNKVAVQHESRSSLANTLRRLLIAK